LVAPGTTELVLSREIARDGKSKCALNGKALSLASLREIGNLLVDFHGQHEHQLILNVASHIDFLDDFGKLDSLRGEVAGKRRVLIETDKRMAALARRIEDVTSKQDFIKHEIKEIESLALMENEDTEIEEEISILENAEKIIQAGSEAAEILYDGDDAALKLISRARALLGKIGPYSRGLESLGENLDQADLIVKEVARALRDSLARIDLDASRLEYLRERSMAVDRIKRKFGKGVAEVLAHLKELKASLENREDLVAEVGRLAAERSLAASELVALAEDLSKQRKAVAARFEKLVETELKSLGMEGGGFRVTFENLENGDRVETKSGKTAILGEKGIDDVEFFIRTNKGEDLLPLRRIASGGEISRVMLALKRILADADRVGTLVFDEIDAGIGGGIADVVADKLHEVAKSKQVICITHLPQIAAAAELHLAVGKASTGGRTVTQVIEVEGTDRVRELARMLAGTKPPRTAVVHAEEMLKRSRSR
jgi:DNA repair protein RecN (Recombination protein N)